MKDKIEARMKKFGLGGRAVSDSSSEIWWNLIVLEKNHP